MVEQEVSLYSVANEIATTYTGIMIAIPELEWDSFSTMSVAAIAAILLVLAQRVRLKAFRKRPGPKKRRPKREGKAEQRHVSTAK